MTLEDAMKERGIRVNELCRKSTVSRPTLDSILGRRRARHKEGIRTGTLLKICDVLNAYAIVDNSNPDYFDVVLKKVENEKRKSDDISYSWDFVLDLVCWLRRLN